MTRHAAALATTLGLTASTGVAYAHFSLTSPPAYSQQDNNGLPEKSAPCGQADPGIPAVPTNIVTSFHAGDTITVTIDERVFHPGHYRVALAQNQSMLPLDPAVTAGATECGSAVIQTSATPGVLLDDQLDHTMPFSKPQSFSVTLPMMECTNCTLQVIQFMSDHGLNNPGGCFYHHCAQVNLVPPGTPLPEAGPPSSGCNAAGSSAAGLVPMLGALGLLVRRRRATH